MSFNNKLHPRNPSNGKFVKHGVGGGSSVATRSRPKSKSPGVRKRASSAVRQGKAASKRSPTLNKVRAARTAHGAYGDAQSVLTHGARAYAYGATGNYVKASLHGAKASTASARLGSLGAGLYVNRSGKFNTKQKKAFATKQAKFDDRVQSVDNIATVGLFLSGSPARKSSKGALSAGIKPAKKKGGAYQITSLKGSKVRK